MMYFLYAGHRCLVSRNLTWVNKEAARYFKLGHSVSIERLTLKPLTAAQRRYATTYKAKRAKR